MNRYIIEPEVAGHFGEGTEWDTSVHPPVVTKLHYVFDGWLGDPLLECFPCFIVEQSVAGALTEAGFTGITFFVAKVSSSTQFRELYPSRALPPFKWLHVSGSRSDDVSITNDGRLVVSHRVLSLLQTLGLSNAEICLATP